LLYTILPIRLWLTPHPKLPEVNLLEQWALGVVYSKIGLRLARFQQPPGGFIRAVDRVSHTVNQAKAGFIDTPPDRFLLQAGEILMLELLLTR
jgi:hypothetical protein